MIFKVWKKPKYIFLFLVMIVASLDGILISSIFKFLINFVSRGFSKGFFYLAGISLLTYFFVVLANYVYNLLKNQFVKDSNELIREKIVQNFLWNKKKYNDATFNGTVSFLLNDVKLFETNYTKPFFDIFLYLFYAITSLIFTLIIDYKLSILFLLFSLVPSIYPFLFKKPLEEKSKIWTNEVSLYTDCVNETIDSASVIQEYKKHPIFLKRHSLFNNNLEKALQSLNNMQSLSIALIGFTSILCYVLPICIGGVLVVNGHSKLENLIAIFMASDRIIIPLKVSFEIYNKLNTVEPIKQKIYSMDWKQKDLRSKIENPYNQIVLKDVCVELDKKNILSQINLTIDSKDKVLIVGESGSGKTILLNLIKGNCAFTGEKKHIINKNHTQLISDILYMSQENVLFKDNLNFNITFDKDIECPSFINEILGIDKEFPENINFKGTNLSGGQAKRINVARSLFQKDRKLLLFDEPFQGIGSYQSIKIERKLLEIHSPIVMVSHKINMENLTLYNKFIVVENKKAMVFDNLNKFKQSDYYKKNVYEKTPS